MTQPVSGTSLRREAPPILPALLVVILLGVWAVVSRALSGDGADSALEASARRSAEVCRRIDGTVAAIQKERPIEITRSDLDRLIAARRSPVAPPPPPPPAPPEPVGPTTTVATVSAPATAAAPASVSAAVEAPRGAALDLSGVFWSARNPLALVNGRLVKPGDTVEGMTVSRIDPEGVTFRDAQGAPYLVNLYRR
jgi:hypothetical protein